MKHSNKENINNNPQKDKQKDNETSNDTKHKTHKGAENKTKENSKSKKCPEQETQNGIELPLLNNKIAKQEADQY